MLWGNPKSVSERHGYRYYLLAKHGRVGTKCREVPTHEYGQIAQALKPYGQLGDLSEYDVGQIVRQLQHLKTHLYEVTHREETPDEILMHLTFVREDLGV